MKRLVALIFSPVMLGGCSDKNNPVPVVRIDYNETENLASLAPAAAQVPSQAVPAAMPKHRYDFHEGELYGYLGAISDEDQKKGVAAPPVVRFRYTGFWDGTHHLQLIGDNGAVLTVNECRASCVAIKETSYDGSIRRVGFSPNSIIGAAFEDAMNGQLQRSPAPGTLKEGYRFKGGDPGNPANWQAISPPTPAPSLTPPAETPSTQVPSESQAATNAF